MLTNSGGETMSSTWTTFSTGTSSEKFRNRRQPLPRMRPTKKAQGFDSNTLASLGTGGKSSYMGTVGVPAMMTMMMMMVTMMMMM